MQYAVIDVGSNTIQLCVYETEGKAFRTLLFQEVTAGLAGYVRQGAMSPEGITQACGAINSLLVCLKDHPVDKLAIFATASLRNVTNTQEAAEAISQGIGHPVQVISGEEEALYSYTGALNSTDLEQGILVDLGGSSTEVVAFDPSGPTQKASLSTGSLKLCTGHVDGLFPTPEEQKQLIYLSQTVIKRFGLSSYPKGRDICGVGGTIRAALKLVNRLDQMPEDNQIITCDQLRRLVDLLQAHRPEIHTLVLQTCPERAKTITPGMLLYREIVNLLECRRTIVSPYGVREGYLLCRMM